VVGLSTLTVFLSDLLINNHPVYVALLIEADHQEMEIAVYLIHSFWMIYDPDRQACGFFGFDRLLRALESCPNLLENLASNCRIVKSGLYVAKKAKYSGILTARIWNRERERVYLFRSYITRSALHGWRLLIF
jgi:hypothetical protein